MKRMMRVFIVSAILQFLNVNYAYSQWNNLNYGLPQNSKVNSLSFCGNNFYAGTNEGLYLSTGFGKL
jgi:hypothetical protein